MMTLDEAIKHCNEVACKHDECAMEHKQLAQWLMELKGYKEQNPAWSEEDDMVLNSILDSIQREGVLEKKRKTDWLNSLKDRIQPQPKQEWSEEEIEKAAQEWDSKANFNPFYMTMDGDKPTGVKQDITTHKESFKAGVNWTLKSLRPQNRWKPSETEISILENIFSGKIDPCNYQATLLNILEQLKALQK